MSGRGDRLLRRYTWALNVLGIERTRRDMTRDWERWTHKQKHKARASMRIVIVQAERVESSRARSILTKHKAFHG